ncbi:hypothetical protein [Nocardia amikacinitolerans]|uniref:hypothetical protein n=1 Tax=Nocardia amikacinitolerans TaxID=756689 RepID=UPI0035580B4F|nr:hypothetical protein [Nocardia amikacinitolerans]
MGYHRNGLRVALAALVSAAVIGVARAEPVSSPGVVAETPQVVAIGSVIEAGVNWSTRNLDKRLNQLGIPATFAYRDTGTHSWGYWQDDLESSWPTLAKGLYSAP